MGNEGIDPLCPSESSLKVEYQLQPIDAEAQKGENEDVLFCEGDTENGCGDKDAKDEQGAGIQHP